MRIERSGPQLRLRDDCDPDYEDCYDRRGTYERRDSYEARRDDYGCSPHRALQAAWKGHGEAAFRFEVLERLEPDESGPVPEYLLRARHEHWLEKLGASRI